MTQQGGKSAYVRTGYIVDTASIAKAIQANAQYQASLKTAQGQTTAQATAAITQLQGERAVLERLSLVAADIEQRRGLDKLAKDAANGVISTQQLARELRNISATKAEIDAVGNSIARLQDEAARGGGGGGLRTGFGTLRAAGAAVGNIGGGQTVTQAASLIGLATLGPAAVAVGVLAIGLKTVTDNASKAADAIQASADALGNARVAALKQTRDLLLIEQDAAKEELRIRRETARQAEAARQAAEFNVVPLAALLGLDANYKGLEQSVASANAELVKAEANYNAITRVLNEGGTAAADATAAEERLAELRERIANAQTTFQNAQLDAAVQAQNLTTAQRNERVAEIQQEIRTRDAYRQSHVLTEEVLISNAVAVDKLRNEMLELNSVVTSTADLLDREKQIRDNAKDTLEQLNDAMQREGEAREALAEISRKMAELDAETAAKRQVAQADAEERRNEIIADGAERRQEIDQQDADRREEILNQFNRSYGDALGNRDALAAVKAKEQRDDELQKQDKANKRQLDQLDKQLDKQLRAVDKALEKQLRSIEDAYQKQQRTLQQSYDRARADLENALQAQRTLQAAYNAMIHNAEIMHQAAMYKTIYDYGEMARIAVENAFRSIANTIIGSMNGVTSNPGNVGGSTQQERDRQAAIAQAYRDYYLRQGMPAQGFSANRMPIFPRASSPGSRNLSGAPARGSLPNVNVTVNVPLFDRASIDKLWPPIRAKLLDEMR